MRSQRILKCYIKINTKVFIRFKTEAEVRDLTEAIGIAIELLHVNHLRFAARNQTNNEENSAEEKSDDARHSCCKRSADRSTSHGCAILTSARGQTQNN